LVGLHVGPESKVPSSAVTLWGAGSLFVHVTEVPAVTFTDDGW
jgi:hypothetical protein